MYRLRPERSLRDPTALDCTEWQKSNSTRAACSPLAMRDLLHRRGVFLVNRLKSQPDSHRVNDLTAQYEQPEHFVDAARAANFLCCSRKHLLNLARTGQVPAHPFGGGSRKTWLFRLSELAAFVLQCKGNGSKMAAGRSSETETR
jgi:hypothetical protein